MGIYSQSAQITLASGVEKTAIFITTASGKPCRLKRLKITDKLATSTDEGIQWRFLTGGTIGTGTTATPVPEDGAAACSATCKINFTVEPTGSPVEQMRNAFPAGGGEDFDFTFPTNNTVAASSTFAIPLKCGTARSVSVEVTLWFEEIG
jgi:hypothetical protein